MPEFENIQEENFKSQIKSSKEEVNESISQEETIEQPQIEQSEIPLLGGTQNSQLQTENMEVHHHPDLHHKRKKFREYFLEFIMIFLAVTLGFFAENIREHLDDNNREKEYMLSMLQDLRQDSLNIENTIRQNEVILRGLDTLAACFSNPMIQDNIDSIYAYCTKYRYDAPHVDFSERTLSQLKNNGGLRLVRDQKVSDDLSTYDQGIRACNAQNEMVVFYYHQLEESEKLLFDFGKVKPLWDTLLKTRTDDISISVMLSFLRGKVYMKTNDRNAFTKYVDEIIYDQVAIGEYNSVELTNQLKKAKSLIGVIQSEYELQ